MHIKTNSQKREKNDRRKKREKRKNVRKNREAEKELHKELFVKQVDVGHTTTEIKRKQERENMKT